MSEALAQRRPVPPEYLGQARQLRWDLAKADDQADLILEQALEPLRTRLDRLPSSLVPRDMLVAAERTWRGLADLYGHLGLVCDIKHRKHPRFVALRASAGRFNREGWTPDKFGSAAADGLLLCLLSVRIDRKLLVEAHVLAALSLHPAARWFERKRRSIADLFEDLQSLALAYGKIIEAGRDAFSFDVPGGRWIGGLATVDRWPALSVQSFWESEYRPIEERQATDLEALIENLPRLVGAG
jgi:hypothetical protein